MGVVECMNHNLVEAFNILHEKEGQWYCMLSGNINEVCYFL